MAKAVESASSSLFDFLFAALSLVAVVLATLFGTFTDRWGNAICLIVGICAYRFLQVSFRNEK